MCYSVGGGRAGAFGFCTDMHSKFACLSMMSSGAPCAVLHFPIDFKHAAATFLQHHAHGPALRLAVDGADDAGRTAVELGAGGNALARV